MSFGKWMQMHRRSILFVVALLALAGALTAFRLPTSLFPNVQFPRAVVSLDAGDRPAEQMVMLVTSPVEEAVRRVPGVQDVHSTSRGGCWLDWCRSPPPGYLLSPKSGPASCHPWMRAVSCSITAPRPGLR